MKLDTTGKTYDEEVVLLLKQANRTTTRAYSRNSFTWRNQGTFTFFVAIIFRIWQGSESDPQKSYCFYNFFEIEDLPGQELAVFIIYLTYKNNLNLITQ